MFKTWILETIVIKLVRSVVFYRDIIFLCYDKV